MKNIYLPSEWTLTSDAVASAVSAVVPGCVHADLRRAGIIPDMFYRDNNKELAYIENNDWCYSCSFEAEAHPEACLVFEGLDTYADVYLNGIHIGSADNMFLPHSFPVGEYLRTGNNRVEVKFRSPIKEVEGLPLHDGAFTRERMNTRRIQCTYSWDWVDRFVTMGIYRPVYLSYPNGIDVEGVYVYTERIDDFGAQIYTEISFKNYSESALAAVEILSPSGEVVGESRFYADRATYVRRFDIADPKLWYPQGYGDSPLYKLRVTVGENTHEECFGIRTIRILQLVDEAGSDYYDLALSMQSTPQGRMYDKNKSFSGFKVIVNGVPVLCKGGNWVPCEPLPSEESDEKIALLVERARDMGVNFLRVWGGGLFEKSAFYDACDRMGILVAQDFLMACGSYPEKEEWFIDALRRESEYAVKYLRNHACLAWWHGDNENATEGSDTQSDYLGRDSALSGLADNIYRYDPNRVFLPSSPYGGETYGSITVGTTHTTNFLCQIFEYFDSSDCRDYKEYLGGFGARFISEEGTFGAISRPSMLKFLTEWDLLGDDTEQMLEYHTKGNPALKKSIFHYMTSYARRAFGAPTDPEDKFFKYKYAQYEWVRVAFEAAKRRLGYCNGLVFWMFNDCWPAALGWSFVDYYCLPKAAYYAFHRLSRELTVSVVEESGKYAAHVTADRNRRVGYKLTARLLSLDGFEQLDEYVASGLSPRYGTDVCVLPFECRGDAVVVADIEYDGGCDRTVYKRGRLTMRPCRGGVSIVDRGEDYITVRAEEYIHALEFEGQYLFSDNYFTMLKGESRTVHFTEYENNGGEDFTVLGYSLYADDDKDGE